MDASQIPDVHSPNFPNSGVLKWMPDGPTVLARMDRSTVKTYTSFLAYTKTFSPYVDRLGLPYGKYFWQLPENGSPFSLEERALDILAMNDPYYQYRIVTLPTGFSAVSMGGSNEFVECFCWGAVVEGGSGAVVELVGDGVEVWLVAGDGGSFG